LLTLLLHHLAKLTLTISSLIAIESYCDSLIGAK
jgi:hypothetical protein